MDHLESLASDGTSQLSPLASASSGESGSERDESSNQNDENTAATKKRKDTVDAWFVDLFVRCNNGRAVEMYEKLGYSVYRRVVE